MKAVAAVIRKAPQRNVYMVLDADALFLPAQPEYRNLLQGYDRAILTPNVMEYKRLYENLSHDDDKDDDEEDPFQSVTIVQKGKTDAIRLNGSTVLTCSEEGGLKRAGGIGDVLSGVIGTMVAWHSILREQRNEEELEEIDLQLACWTACCLVKRATKRAFELKR